MTFSAQIIFWYEEHKRDLPWRGIKDPYKIWLSEIILQQTRVEQGTPYYHRFIKQYPNIQNLAEVHEDEVLKLWQGLGYYSRARNLHLAAKQVMQQFGGKFPNTYKEILSLKGVGEYTAAAIASFAYDLPHAVVDGNVYRLLARYFGIYTPINSTEGKKTFFALANKLLDKQRVSDYNQGIMEFGSQQCKAINPDCRICPLQKSCVAFEEKSVTKLPVKLKTSNHKKLYFDYFFIEYQGNTYLKKRKKKGIWQNLYDFPLIENEKKTNEKDILREVHKFLKVPFEVFSISKEYKHILSHRTIFARFWSIKIISESTLKNTKKIPLEDLEKYPIPRLIELFLQDKGLTNTC
ncbi:MAG: A/G-specific adenine glycosylase [Flavobacteriales bacterium]|nr:A/G-specific adenine glycosylase [Flavobacteriales bacterium]|tara:strand:- start:37 stop:1086 length:1050 start_codon:yes stop_codon:yes gene_type:complete